MLSDSWQGSNSAEFSSSLEKIALMSRGKRVILCIGNIKKDCIFRDWQTGLHSSSFNESTNRGFSLHQKFAIVNATPLHPYSVSKSMKKVYFFLKKIWPIFCLLLIGIWILTPKMISVLTFRVKIPIGNILPFLNTVYCRVLFCIKNSIFKWN